jgi:5'-nucleotidase
MIDDRRQGDDKLESKSGNDRREPSAGRSVIRPASADMRILITNDDGIHSEGLDICAEIGQQLSDDVWVIAPEFDQSGVSHSLSLNDPLRLREIDERRFAVKGTPTDCVIMGARHLMQDRPPDLVLAGVNRGRNAGEDVIYSGTVAGAVEGTILGIPSFALSQAYRSRNGVPPHWDTAVRFAPDIIRRVLDAGIPRDVLININFPDCAPADVKGISVATQGRNLQERLQIDARQDGRGNAYYWIAYVRNRAMPPQDGSDISALFDNRISVTPLRLDMTDEPFLTRLAELFD